MRLLDVLDYRPVFLLLCNIDSVIMIDSGDRFIRRNLDDIHSVNIAELLLLCQSGTCHTCLLLIFIEEVLEGDGGKRLALALYLYVLLRLNRLMQSVGITAARKHSSGKLIYDVYLIILDNVIAVLEHQVVCAERQDDIVLDLKILRI